MVKRIGGLWPGVVAFENLRSAAFRAARGKRHLAGVARFLERLEPNILELQRALEEETYRPGRPARFLIHDPKVRMISAAPFRDRVVHHALIDPLEPIFERRMRPESYACRRGKGTLAALRQAQRLVRQYGYFLKLDVRRFFPSLSHAVVMDTLARILKDARVLRLAERILRGDGTPEGRGLPIGNLTSQWFANLVLDRLDHFLKEERRIPGYLRYMDDMALFAEERARLEEAREEVRSYLADPLGLMVKEEATILAPARVGLPFLGWQVHRGVLRLRGGNRRRLRRRLLHREWEYRTGRIGEEDLARSVQSTVAYMRQGSTRGLRRTWFFGGPERRDEVAGPKRSQPGQSWGRLQQHRRQRAVREPEQQPAGEPEQQPGRPPSPQGVAMPERRGRPQAGTPAPCP